MPMPSVLPQSAEDCSYGFENICPLTPSCCSEDLLMYQLFMFVTMLNIIFLVASVIWGIIARRHKLKLFEYRQGLRALLKPEATCTAEQVEYAEDEGGRDSDSEDEDQERKERKAAQKKAVENKIQEMEASGKPKAVPLVVQLTIPVFMLRALFAADLVYKFWLCIKADKLVRFDIFGSAASLIGFKYEEVYFDFQMSYTVFFKIFGAWMLSALPFWLVTRPLKGQYYNRYLVLLLLIFCNIFYDLGNLMSEWLYLTGITTLTSRVVQLVITGVILNISSKLFLSQAGRSLCQQETVQELANQYSQENCLNSIAHYGFKALKALETFNQLKKVRMSFRRCVRTGINYLVGACVLISIVFSLNNFDDFLLISTFTNSWFPPSKLTNLQDARLNHIQSQQFTSLVTNKVKTRTLVLIYSGLRYDQMHANPDMNALVGNLTLPIGDGRLYEMSAEWPSMSVSNWLSMFSGVPPYVSGVSSNVPRVPQMNLFDTVFKQAAIAKPPVVGSIIGSEFFQDFIATSSPAAPLVDRLHVNWEILSGDARYTAEAFDEYHKSLTLQWLREAAQDETYFVAQFSSLVKQGLNGHGVYTSEYQTALSRFAHYTREILDTADENTIVIVTSEVGMESVGAMGGNTPDARSVPLLVYKKNSNFADSRYNLYKAGQYHPALVDLAPTLAALFDVPKPRHNLGRFIDEVLLLLPWDEMHVRSHYLDLRNQRLEILLTAADLTENEEVEHTEELFRSPRPLNVTSKEFYGEEINRFTSIWDRLTAGYVKEFMGFRLWFTSIIFAFFASIALLIAQRFTFLDPVSIFLGFQSLSRKRNTLAMFCAAALVSSYFILMISTLYIHFIVMLGFDEWSSSFIPGPLFLPHYFGHMVSFGIIYSVLICRSFIWYLATPMATTSRRGRPYSLWKRQWKRMQWVLSSMDELKVTDMGLVYLIRGYILICTVMVLAVLTMIQSLYRLPIPGHVANVLFYTGEFWNLRFRLTSVGVMTLPFLMISFLAVFDWPSWRVQTPEFDTLYVLKEWKDMRSHKTRVLRAQKVKEDVQLVKDTVSCSCLKRKAKKEKDEEREKEESKPLLSSSNESDDIVEEGLARPNPLSLNDDSAPAAAASASASSSSSSSSSSAPAPAAESASSSAVALTQPRRRKGKKAGAPSGAGVLEDIVVERQESDDDEDEDEDEDSEGDAFVLNEEEQWREDIVEDPNDLLPEMEESQRWRKSPEYRLLMSRFALSATPYDAIAKGYSIPKV